VSGVTHLRRVGIITPDPEGLAGFYEQVWGLTISGRREGTVYLRGSGTEHHLLAISPGARPSVRLIGLGLADAGAVDEFAARLSALPEIRLLSQPRELTDPGGGYAAALADPDGRVVELSAAVSEVDPAAGVATVRPVKLSHVVLNSARGDAFSRLLVDALGFRLADEMPHMRFYRCSADHHSIAVTNAPYASLNHIAFEVPSCDDVLRGIGNMTAHGFETVWGPGRHGPGNNVFGYFAAPNRQVIEYTAEVEQIPPGADPPARMWLPGEISVRDPWAAPDSARPTAHARELMLGDPEDQDASAGGQQ
jgi:catechol 2,3-dioxygenase-like lactoylglutathione lyase family enzyme